MEFQKDYENHGRKLVYILSTLLLYHKRITIFQELEVSANFADEEKWENVDETQCKARQEDTYSQWC